MVLEFIDYFLSFFFICVSVQDGFLENADEGELKEYLRCLKNNPLII
jgi:hypothetical protein